MLVTHQQAVDDEAWGVLALNGGLAQLLAQIEKRLKGLVGSLSNADDFEQLHDGNGVEEVITAEPIHSRSG